MQRWGKSAAGVVKEGKLDSSVYILLSELKSCCIRRNLERGKRIHAKILESGHASSIHVATALVKMYAKCGRMVEARLVFDGIKHPDVVSWTALILGYAENGEGAVALDLFSRMKSRGLVPDSVTYVAALKSCTSLALKLDGAGMTKCLERGKQLHSEIGCYLDLSVQNTLVDMYAKCGSMREAHEVFRNIRKPDVVSWNILLLGYAEAGDGLIALDLFSKMKSEGCTPDAITFVAALKACAGLATKQCKRKSGAEVLLAGKRIHSEIGCHLNLYVQNALIDMYAKCGSMLDAYQVFASMRHPDVVSWNTLLLGYEEAGEGLVVLDLFSAMKSQGFSPDSITFVAALKACGSLALKHGPGATWLTRGKEIHSEIRCHLDLYVQNTLIDMYAKCGSILDAHQVFSSIRHPSIVSWNALLSGYADCGEGLVTLDLFWKMKSRGFVPDSITFVAALKACSLLRALEIGKKLHAEISEYDAVLVTCLVDFYAKCGNLVEAQEVFDLHYKTRDLTTWTALLAGYCSFGQTKSVQAIFEGMQDAGFQPNGVTFQCLLMSCSHAGLVGKARDYFVAMSARYGITPGVEHYTCMLDALCRANRLDDAIRLLHTMSCSPNAVTWMTVLSACRKWKNVDIGRLAFESLLSLEEGNAAPYVLMAHIYASRHMWQQQGVILAMRRNAVGNSCINSYQPPD